MNNDETVWCEKYRPVKVEQCILPQNIKDGFSSFVKSGNIPTLLLSGGPGTGKTTIAIAMCKELQLDYILINSSDERGIDVLRDKVKNYAATISLSGKKRIVILDEADNITPDAQAALRGMIEDLSSNCSFILTCNFKSKIISPLHSRCQSVDFTIKPTEAKDLKIKFYQRMKDILDKEGVQFKPKILVKIIDSYFPDFRKTINETQRLAASFNNVLDENCLKLLKNSDAIEDLIKFLKAKEFTNMRQWVSENLDMDTTSLFRNIYNNMYTYIKEDNIPQLVLILAKYQFQASFVADQEINLVAALTEILIECEFK